VIAEGYSKVYTLSYPGHDIEGAVGVRIDGFAEIEAAWLLNMAARAGYIVEEEN